MKTTHTLKSKRILWLIGLFLITLLVVMRPLLVEGSTIRVPEDYSSIQDAVDHASPGDIIIIRAGVYSGFTVSKSLVILGESNQSVIIRGSVTVTASNVRLGSLRVELTEDSDSTTALIVLGNNTVIVGIIIESYKHSIQLGNVNKRVYGTLVEYSRIVSEDVGVYGSCSDLSVFYSEIISKKQAVVGCGILDLEFNSIVGDTAVSTSFWYRGSLVKYNNITGKTTGLYIDGSENTISGNRITSDSTGILLTGILLKGSQNIVENNIISGSNSGILVTSSNNVIIRNIIESGGHAIDLNGNGNLITNNTLSGSRGVHANGAYGNTISFNFVDKTSNIGVYLSKYTGDNFVYGNTFWYCYNYEGVDESGKNQWYLENETYKLGNYWSCNKAPDNNGDGITDEPYHIATTTNLEIVDKYPLANPIVTPNQLTPTSTWITQTSSEYTSSTETQHETGTPSGISIITVTAIVVGIILVIGLILLYMRGRGIRYF